MMREHRTLGMLLVGALAVVLASILVPALKAASPEEPDMLVQVLGGSAGFAAEKTFDEADIYFHAGMTEGCPDHDHEKKHVNEAEAADLPLAGIIGHLHGQTAPKLHKHLQGEDEKELLPWFVATVRLNPHHVEAWRVGTYWFARTGNIRQAQEFIDDGIRHNPKESGLYLERGILYHQMRRWERAVRDLETAERLWRNESDDSIFELRAIHSYLKNSREQLQASSRQPRSGQSMRSRARTATTTARTIR